MNTLQDEDEESVRSTTYGSFIWYKKGTNIYHRLNGPAIEDSNGTRCWYINGRLHRLNGPAIEYFSESNPGPRHWYYNGKQIECSSLEEFKRLINLLVFL